jgi:hypothetical protein
MENWQKKGKNSERLINTGASQEGGNIYLEGEGGTLDLCTDM